MDAKDYWMIFMETGLPEAYMLYSLAKRMEISNVSKHESAGPEGNGVQ